MSFYPSYQHRQVVSLDGLWQFSFLGTEVDLDGVNLNSIPFDTTMPVPQAFDAMPGFQGQRGTCAYRTSLRVTPGCRSQIRFGGLGLWARVVVDGVALADWALPYSPFTVDLPPSDHEQRTLVVLIDNRLDPKRVPLVAPHFDFYLYGGLWRSVTLHQFSHAYHIERIQIDATSIETGIAQVKLHLAGTVPDQIDLSIAHETGDTVTVFSELTVLDSVVSVSIPVSQHRCWSPETPHLHTLHFRLKEGEEIIDDQWERFGFRKVSVEAGQIRLNGKPIKLLGFCRHEAHPAFGPALPLAQLAIDVALLKDMGCNFVRGSHYSQDQRFLSLCDEQGMLVFEESLAWGNSAEQYSRPRFAEDQETQTRQMVRESFNHPSVILWGFLNEGRSKHEDSRALYERLAGALREEDSSRLITFATMFPFEDINLDLVDVISTNIYPGWYTESEEVRPLGQIEERIQGIRKSFEDRGFAGKPHLISEIGAAALYGWRDAHNGPYTEQYQSDLLEEACRQVLTRSDLAGIAIWQMFDCRTYTTCRAIGRPRTFNNKGVLDEYRRPKQAFQTVKKLFWGSRDHK